MPSDYNPENDIPDLTGKSIFITGGTGGLGAESAIHLAKHNPSHIYLSGRNATSAEKVIKQIHGTNPDLAVTFIKCDLASLTSVKGAAEHFTSQHQTLDIPMCNAGTMANPPGLTVDGYEFLPLLEASRNPRLVILTSQGWGCTRAAESSSISPRRHRILRSAGRGGGMGRVSWPICCMRELAKRFPAITSVSVHPGVARTSLVNDLSLKDRMIVYGTTWWVIIKAHEGAFNQTWVATVDKAQIRNGGYYEPVGKLEDGKLDETAKDEGACGEIVGLDREGFDGLLI
ncbi:hypothetical protein N7447_007487 [Penicillium robsamsonii]|uniref:uncharacterized protein n=1 Tax=Penicillium robsamsonii TaxID=1792511 RepID=UPI0025472977|nr:uncharacterized protein N7447_007487 [Penicillium robsamsonii]KAJ5825147.1 hypothetical protein N7447_007487 [Penicillium robsamsonii]